MTQEDDRGYLEIQLNLFGAEVLRFRLAVDDFQTKWVLIGIASISALSYLAIEIKESFL